MIAVALTLLFEEIEALKERVIELKERQMTQEMKLPSEVYYDSSIDKWVVKVGDARLTELFETKELAENKVARLRLLLEDHGD